LYPPDTPVEIGVVVALSAERKSLPSRERRDCERTFAVLGPDSRRGEQEDGEGKKRKCLGRGVAGSGGSLFDGRPPLQLVHRIP
jgi:hypothetical protein